MKKRILSACIILGIAALLAVSVRYTTKQQSVDSAAAFHENMEDLKTIIDECLEDPGYAQGRRQVREETWAFVSEGAVRAADYLCGKLDELMGKEQ